MKACPPSLVHLTFYLLIGHRGPNVKRDSLYGALPVEGGGDAIFKILLSIQCMVHEEEASLACELNLSCHSR